MNSTFGNQSSQDGLTFKMHPTINEGPKSMFQLDYPCSFRDYQLIGQGIEVLTDNNTIVYSSEDDFYPRSA